MPATETKAFGVEPSTHAYRLRLSRYQAMAEAIAEYVRATPQQSPFNLIDVGVGNGRTLRYVEAQGIELAEKIHFVGVDLSPRRLAGLYRPDLWRLVHANVERRLPFDAQTFDIAICEQVLEHLHQPRVAIDEIHRILKPGGLFIAGVPIFIPPLRLLRSAVWTKVAKLLPRRSDHVQTFSLGTIRRLIAHDHRFQIIAARGFRVMSGGLLKPLENTRRWYELNRALGRAVPWACTEIQILARKGS